MKNNKLVWICFKIADILEICLNKIQFLVNPISNLIKNSRYFIRILSIIIGSFIQPIFSGSSFGIGVILLIFGFGYWVILTDLKILQYKPGIKTLYIFLIGLFLSFINFGKLTNRERLETYYFNENKELANVNKIRFNVPFHCPFKDLKQRESSFEFNLSTNEGSFDINHQCKAYIDTLTWQKFNLNEDSLYTFIKNDAKNRIITSFGQCKLNEIQSLQKEFHYTNGYFSWAKLEKIRI